MGPALSRREHPEIRNSGSLRERSKSPAEEKRDQLIGETNARNSLAPDPDITFGEFLEGVCLPFMRSKWKRSTAATTENRVGHHLGREFGVKKLYELGVKELQSFLAAKSETLSRSVVAHLRWDLRAIFRLALAEGYTERDPTTALFTPKQATVTESRVMNTQEVKPYIKSLELRVSVIAHLALFAGMRPGEILALQRRHISVDCRKARIEQRLYRGDIDTPKTASLLKEWMELVGTEPEAWVFASENPSTPMWRDNVWYRHMKPRLEAVGL